MSKPNLQVLLKKWQRRLRLQDFDISICYGGHHTIDGVGRCHINWHLGTARIEILEPSANTYAGQHMQDVELTTVHELLHIMLNPLFTKDAPKVESDYQEQVIEKIAKALVHGNARP